MSLYEELQKKPKAPIRIKDYLRWAVLVVLVAVAVVAAVILGILAIAGESAAEVIEYVLHHIYIHYGLIPVLVVLLVVAVAAVAFVVQLVFTYLVFWKAYAEKRGQNAEIGAKPALLDAAKKKTGWSKGYYQGVVLLVTNVIIAVLLVAGGVYSLGYIGIDAAEQPKFCTMCHEVMDKPYESYMASTHKGIHCGACHNDPGVKGFVKGEVIAPIKEGWLQAAGRYHLDEHGHLLPSAVPINNKSCLSGECHKEKRLREEEFHYKGFVFRHDKHIDIKHGGQVLTCDACHAYDKKIHMKVDNNTCGLCHFSEKKAIKEPACEACHALRTKLQDEAKELMHAQAADFEKQACNNCHTALKAPLILHEEACGEKCHHRHGEDMKLSKIKGGAEEVHKTHVHAGCSACHQRAHHKIDHSKFTKVQMKPFGKKFTHENHTQDCHECHARKQGRFALTLEDKKDCSKCHHAEDKVSDTGSCAKCHKDELPKTEAFGRSFSHEAHDEDCTACHAKGAKDLTLTLKSYADCTACHHAEVDDTDSCDSCHEFKNIKAFGKKFAHKSHEEKCSVCHVKGAEDLTVKLKGRGDCNACHHDGVDDPESCEDCHEKQQEFFSGDENKKFGMAKMSPEVYQDVEKVCVTCHGEDVTRYEPSLARKTCIECHEDDPDYNPDNLVKKGRAGFEKAVMKLVELEGRVKSAKKMDVALDKILTADKALIRARKMMNFLEKDASFGIHNPGLFEAYLEKIDEVFEEAGKALKEAGKSGK